MNHLQLKVQAFVRDHQLSTSVETRLLDAMAELGELSKEALRSTSYGKRPFTPSAAFSDELGDLLFSVLCVANEAGVDGAQALEAALAKYERRLSTSGTAASPNQPPDPTFHAHE